jgi:hypothetical protein
MEPDGSLVPPPVVPTFDEAAYLQANPDVAQAVQDGHFPSGWDHYLRYGFREQRPGVSAAGYAAARSSQGGL